jgi:protein phosphatase
METRTAPQIRESPRAVSVPGRLGVSSYGLTDRGRERARNEDQFLVAEIRRVLQVRQSSLPQPTALLGDQLGHLFVVADGIGGQRAGEYASALAVMSVENMLLNTIGWLFRLKGEGVLAEFQEVLRVADRWVEEATIREPQLRGMGSTLTMAYATGGVLYVAHVGDSRCYLWREGRLTRLTRDHTLVEGLVQAGAISREEAAHHNMRNVITNAVGGGTRGVDPEVHKQVIAAEDLVLLCTDGLTEMLPDEEIAAVLSARRTSPEEACHQLVAQANSRGGADNISVVVARFDATGEMPPRSQH